VVKRLVLTLGLILILTSGLPAVAQEHLDDEGATATEQLLNTVEVPPRDRIALAQRFWRIGDISRTAEEPPDVFEIGDRRQFVVDNTDLDEQFNITAELIYATEHTYWWLEDGYSLDSSSVSRSAERFERDIYPTTRYYFGSEWSPGVDNDPHIYVLIAEQLGYSVAGYYSSANQYPREAVPTSNEAEMFLISAPNMGMYIGTDYFDEVMAHEFQHMIHWAVDINEDTWVNEGLSELSTLLNGFASLGSIPSFLVAPNTQLTTWPEDGPRTPHYGVAHLFFTYMLERFGEETIMRVVSEPANGMTGIDNALRAVGVTDPLTGAPVTANDVFADWLVANYLNDPDVLDGRYAYSLIPVGTIGATREHYAFPVYESDVTWPQYAGQYIRLAGTGTVQFSFDGQEFVGLLPTAADAHSGEYVFWGHRSDESNTTLTRAFDLRDVGSATLEYWTWYHIESLWDYAYITISTDGGATWSILETPNTTNANPHDTAYGPGYTGLSGGDGRWIQERIDLTPYTGQEVLVRFEYVTDDATLQHGLVIDDVAIPEIGYAEDFEAGDGGWESAGWIRHNNRLPQRYVVQLIDVNTDGKVYVSLLLGPDDGASGTWNIKLDGTREVVVVVSGFAPVTTQQVVYSYAIEPLAGEGSTHVGP
jgi:hypothetical protein